MLKGVEKLMHKILSPIGTEIDVPETLAESGKSFSMNDLAAAKARLSAFRQRIFQRAEFEFVKGNRGHGMYLPLNRPGSRRL